ncbi:MAG: PDZ domain-containing protein [Treponema sp.]|jgi:regulator of sigma E protease|nr:PDZ domain-containing protein [Treponema sp.]
MKWLWGILCLFFLILFHEFGHFIAAKVFGVKVESFSIGFGPVLFHKLLRGTDFRFSLIPLGGYCGMKGEKDFSEALQNNSPIINASKDSLYGIHPIKRALIGFAGPFFNFLFAVIAFSIISQIGYSYYTYSSKIILSTDINPEYVSPAKEGGLLSGDTILSINGKKINNFSDIIEEISIRPNENIDICVNRNDEIKNFTIRSSFDKESGSGKIGITADTKNLLKIDSERYIFPISIFHGFSETFTSIYKIFKSIKILFMGVKIQNAVSGPARVTDILGSTISESFSVGIREGFVNMLNLMAFISISLCIMNLLPIPILDGGLILIALIEFVSKRKIAPKIQYYLQFIGIIFIVIIFCIGLFGDISYFINKPRF